MARFSWILAAMFLFAGQAARAGDDIEDDNTLSRDQKKQLKQVQEDFAALTKKSNKTEKEKQTALRDSLRTALVQNSQPSDQSIDKLAGTMGGFVGGGDLTVRDSTLIMKKLTKFLENGDFSFKSTEGLVKGMEGLIQGNLGAEGRNQLYESILTVVSTADGNARKK